MRKLTKQTIKPVLKFIGGWGSDIHSWNTKGADFYEFTLDTYNGKNSWVGGFSWGLDGCYNYDNKPNQQYAIDLNNGKVYELKTQTVVMQVKE